MLAGVDEREQRKTPTSCRIQPMMYVVRRPMRSEIQPAKNVESSHVTAEPATAQSTGPRSSPIGPFGVRRVVLDVAAGGHVADGVVAREDERGDEHEQRVLAEQLHDRHPRLLLALGELDEHRALLDAAAHVVADEDQHDREQERHAPAPREERVARGDHGHERHDAARRAAGRAARRSAARRRTARAWSWARARRPSAPRRPTRRRPRCPAGCAAGSAGSGRQMPIAS